MNHTSDEHPWFKESRSSRGQRQGGLVCLERRRPEVARRPVVFTDVERSNWTWDDNRQQYYWHRFFHHQPDLNYDNPEVADTMIDLVRFWLDLGFDGFRLDAVPYLYQHDGTTASTCPRRTRSSSASASRSTPTTPAASSWRRRTAGRATWPTTSATAISAPLLPLPAHAAPLHGGAARAAVPDHRDPGADPGHRRRLPVGDLPAEPRRAHPRTGQRRRSAIT